MRSTRFIALLLVLLGMATVARAQAPRTITFQGRARDAGGTYIDDQRQMTLSIYTSPTGGTALFTETHTVKFDKGVFTVLIGGATSGEIPASIPFDRPYWVGLRIQNFNDGNELEPRLRLSSSPYAFRATVADRAVRSDDADSSRSTHLADSSMRAAYADSTRRAQLADSAIAVAAPITIVGPGKEVAVRIASPEGVGLHVRGQTYAIVSEGIDSSARYFVSGQTLGATTKPTPGALYRDNTPVAWAMVSPNGTFVSDFGMLRIAKDATQQGRYEITLDNPLATVTVGDVQMPMVAPVITPGGSGTGPVLIASWSVVVKGQNPDPSTIRVDIRNTAGEGVDSPFSIVVFGRP